ncbi:uncharacterized protein CCOS01_12053 [Colletotrichum costaricense]|uniref:Uncharacterized protein n=1 Tax=Colletotrichum costaricense TaxID=1209916 RepID=A0AAJ0DWW0_9PEZI|nr:uncharacterized protein CCOS01_12053 [Colletotrichum costaricense]KAK1517796.1 hypothetical protein CCOS01_12053 [Colletotrichum costaricense]
MRAKECSTSKPRMADLRYAHSFLGYPEILTNPANEVTSQHGESNDDDDESMAQGVTAGLSVPKVGPPSPALPLLYPASLIEAPAISVRHYRGAPRGGDTADAVTHHPASTTRQCEYPPVGRIKATTYIHDLPLPGAVQRRHRDNLSLLSPSSSLASHTCALWSNLFGTWLQQPSLMLCNLETALCQKDPQRPLSPAPAAAAAAHLRFT